MTKLFKYTLSMVALCGALASCSDETTSGGNANNNDGKELIALSGNDNGVTRAALTRAGFSKTAETKVVMRIKAEATGQTPRFTEATATAGVETTEDNIQLSKLTYDANQARYWDDAFGRNSKLTIYAFAIPGKTNAELPTWAKTDWQKVDASTNPNWYTGTEYTTVTWGVKTVQTAATMLEDNLTYSNNISADTNLGKGGRYYYTYDTSNSTWTENKFGDGPLTWTAKVTGETTGKFDKGHLVFNHALAWIEINLKEGNGYDNTSTSDFQWTNTTTDQNITLKGFNTSGTFNVADATWSNFTSDVDITKINENAVTASARQLYAYVLPGTDLLTNENNVVEFELDNSKYYVTGKQIAEAIQNYYKTTGINDANATEYQSFNTIKAGKHYVINLNVAKKGIEKITAAIVDWETVNSNDADAKNTYAEFKLDDRGTNNALGSGSDSKFNLYRATQTASDYITGTTEPNYAWNTGYGDAAGKEWNDTKKVWNSKWYWDNNKTYYHFRAAGADAIGDASSVAITTDGTNGDYFAIKSGALSGPDYKDYIWGAPFNMNYDNTNSTYNNFTYSTTNGFDGTGTSHQLSQAIGATDSQINMLLFHMTSQITVNVKTTTDDNNKVTLNDGTNSTKVEILNFLPDGKVLMGNGFVAASGKRTSAEMTTGTCVPEKGTVGAYVPCTYGIVPQSLSYTGGTIGLRITTPDGNQYVVSDLSKCTATVTSKNLVNPYTLSSGVNYVIDAWYPGYQYTYNITIKKTGIERITAAVVGWETVEGDNIDIDLEN
jgi:hypothetical protein